eukprot:symbB.v1.2.032685.t1/scaffold3957.1/size47491/7
MYLDFSWKDAPLACVWVPVITGIAYLLIVSLLPKIVPNGGYRVEGILVAHNFFLSGFSLVMFLGCAVEVFHRVQADGWGWTVCEEPGGRSAGPLYFWTYVFYVSKLYELLDTILVMVKGSRPQHYMLHVFHHSAVPVLVWAWLQWQMLAVEQFGARGDVFLLWAASFGTAADSALDFRGSQFLTSIPCAFLVWPKIKAAPFGDICAGQRTMWANFLFNLTLLVLFWQVEAKPRTNHSPVPLQDVSAMRACKVGSEQYCATAQPPDVYPGPIGEEDVDVYEQIRSMENYYQETRNAMAVLQDEARKVEKQLVDLWEGISGALAWCCDTGAHPGRDGTEAVIQI